MKYTSSPDFSLQEFSNLNLSRCDNPLAFNCANQPLLYWSTAIAEEAGEICGAVKNLARGFNQRELAKMKKKWLKNHELATKEELPSDQELEAMWLDEKEDALIKEAADVFIYLDLLAQKSNKSLWGAIQAKFNEVSREMGLDNEYILYSNNTNI